MAFYIKKFEGRRGRERGYTDHYDIAAYFGFVGADRLPLDFEGEVSVPLKDGRQTFLRCFKRPRDTVGRPHRCYVICPDCGAEVAAGRTHQHKCK